jgi:hypothetical protein
MDLQLFNWIGSEFEKLNGKEVKIDIWSSGLFCLTQVNLYAIVKEWNDTCNTIDVRFATYYAYNHGKDVCIGLDPSGICIGQFIQKRFFIPSDDIIIQSCIEGREEWYSVFQGFRQAKSANGGSILSMSPFLILPQLPQRMKFASKVVKVDLTIIILLPKI